MKFVDRQLQEQLAIVEATGKALDRIRDSYNLMSNCCQIDNLAAKANSYIDILTQLNVVEVQLLAGLVVTSPNLPDLMHGLNIEGISDPKGIDAEAPGRVNVLSAITEEARELQARLDRAVVMLMRYRECAVIPLEELDALLDDVTAPLRVEVSP